MTSFSVSDTISNAEFVLISVVCHVVAPIWSKQGHGRFRAGGARGGHSF